MKFVIPSFQRPKGLLEKTLKYLDFMNIDRNEVYVFINGVPNYDWYYVRSDNTVYFDIVPESNDLVEVAYPYYPIEFETEITIPFN